MTFHEIQAFIFRGFCSSWLFPEFRLFLFFFINEFLECRFTYNQKNAVFCIFIWWIFGVEKIYRCVVFYHWYCDKFFFLGESGQEQYIQEKKDWKKLLTKSAILATWIASWTTSALVLPFRISNIALSTTMAVSMYLVASRTSLLYRPAPFRCCSSTIPDMCFCRRDIRHSIFPEFAQPLFASARASKIKCGCFCWNNAKNLCKSPKIFVYLKSYILFLFIVTHMTYRRKCQEII